MLINSTLDTHKTQLVIQVAIHYKRANMRQREMKLKISFTSPYILSHSSQLEFRN